MPLSDILPRKKHSEVTKLISSLSRRNSASLKKEEEKHSLALFHAMAKRVPAYRDFLSRNGINPESITTYSDFLKVPPTTKENYIKQYSLAELSWDGEVDAIMLSTSSGSSGEPQFWPRGNKLETETSHIYEILFREFFELESKKTLVINAYSMGLYVAGTFTLNSCITIGKKGYPLTVITPGINKDDVLKIVAKIGSSFDQVVLCAYPPLAKDIIDEGKALGINWEDYHMRFISGGEAYSEKWRNHLYKSAGVPGDRYLTSSVNTYGSADAAILGHETPLSILIRKLASDDKNLCKALFGRVTVPSFHQYYPFWKQVSTTDEGELCFTADAGLPLLRYNIEDRGGTYTHREIMAILKKHGYSEESIVSQLPRKSLNWKLPFVYLFGRTNAAATIYGLNIYPENIKAALEHDEVFPHVSGKFLLATEYNRSQDQYLSLKLELKKDANLDRKTLTRIRRIIYETIREMNAEFKVLSDTFPKRAKPRVKFHTYAHPKHFPSRIKVQYVKKP